MKNFRYICSLVGGLVTGSIQNNFIKNVNSKIWIQGTPNQVWNQVWDNVDGNVGCRVWNQVKDPVSNVRIRIANRRYIHGYLKTN